MLFRSLLRQHATMLATLDAGKLLPGDVVTAPRDHTLTAARDWEILESTDNADGGRELFLQEYDPAIFGEAVGAQQSVEGTVIPLGQLVPSTPIDYIIHIGTVPTSGGGTIAGPPTGAVRSTNIVTITTLTPHDLQVSMSVWIQGVTDASFNGTFNVTEVPSPTTFKYAQTGPDAASGNGTVTPNWFSYRRISSEVYDIVAGDELHFDTYVDPNSPTSDFGLDFEYGAPPGGTGKTARDDSDLHDQNGIWIHPGADQAAWARGQWYHRIFKLDGLVGQRISSWASAWEGNAIGSYKGRLATIKIVNGTTVKSFVFSSESLGETPVWAPGGENYTEVYIYTAETPAEVQTVVNVSDYGANGVGKATYDGKLTPSSAVLVLADNHNNRSKFLPSDVGKQILIRGGAVETDDIYQIYTTIKSYISAISVELNATSLYTVNAADVFWGWTDDTAAVQTAIDSANLSQPQVYAPGGVYGLSAALTYNRNLRRFFGDGSKATVFISMTPSHTNKLVNFLDSDRLRMGHMSFEGPGMNAADGGQVNFGLSTDSNIEGLILEDLLVNHVADTGFHIKTGILTTLVNVKALHCALHGIHLDGGTSMGLFECYGICVGRAAIFLQGVSYSSAHNCAVEVAGTGYWILGGQSNSLINCGAEDMLNRSVDHPGDAYRLEGTYHNTLICPYSRDVPGATGHHLHIKGTDCGDNIIIAERVVQGSVPPPTDVLIEADCGANLIIGGGATISDLSGKVAIIPTLSPFRFAGLELTGAADWGAMVAGLFKSAFRITTDGYQSWGPGDGTFDASLYRLSAGLLKLLAVLRIADTTQHLASSVWGAAADAWAFRITSAGYHSWGPGDDTYDASLYRVSAGKLQLLGALETTDTATFPNIYTKTEIDSLLAGKASSTHTHGGQTGSGGDPAHTHPINAP